MRIHDKPRRTRSDLQIISLIRQVDILDIDNVRAVSIYSTADTVVLCNQHRRAICYIAQPCTKPLEIQRVCTRPAIIDLLRDQACVSIRIQNVVATIPV